MTSKQMILANNLIYMFVFSALMVLLPLYLIEKNISLESIGIILSILPLTFLIVRLFLGSLADEVGEKKILLIESLAVFLSPIIYAIAATPILFGIGKIVGGVRDSAFWAVSRTEIIHTYGLKHAEKSLAFFGGARILADAAGRFVIGLSIAAIGFYNSLLGLSLLGLFLFFIFVGQRETNKNKLNLRHTLGRLIKRRSIGFWKISFGLMSLALATGLLFVFLFPVFMFQELEMSYPAIGGALAILLLITGLFTLIQLYYKISTRKLGVLTILMMGSAILLFPILREAFWLLIIIFGIGHGSASILYEEILGNAIKKSKDLSTDIGVIQIPLRIGEFISFFAVGFAITRFGYIPIFALCAALVTLFGFFAISYFSDSKHQIG